MANEDRAMAARAGKRRRDGLIRRIWAWLTDTGYHPERHYMRGGRTVHQTMTAS